VPLKIKKRLNVLVMGETGTGKSCFVEHLLLNLNESAALNLLQSKGRQPFLMQSTTKIIKYPVQSTSLKVNIIDTPGHKY
jgi:septin family protein